VLALGPALALESGPVSVLALALELEMDLAPALVLGSVQELAPA
jgi:hypothetical protein